MKDSKLQELVTEACLTDRQIADLQDQQQKLMENMKSMEPLLKTAQSFLDKFESSSMGKLFEKIPGMSSMFGGAQAGNVKGAAP